MLVEAADGAYAGPRARPGPATRRPAARSSRSLAAQSSSLRQVRAVVAKLTGDSGMPSESARCSATPQRAAERPGRPRSCARPAAWRSAPWSPRPRPARPGRRVPGWPGCAVLATTASTSPAAGAHAEFGPGQQRDVGETRLVHGQERERLLGGADRGPPVEQPGQRLGHRPCFRWKHLFRNQCSESSVPNSPGPPPVQLVFQAELVEHLAAACLEQVGDRLGLVVERRHRRQHGGAGERHRLHVAHVDLAQRRLPRDQDQRGAAPSASRRPPGGAGRSRYRRRSRRETPSNRGSRPCRWCGTTRRRSPRSGSPGS